MKKFNRRNERESETYSTVHVFSQSVEMTEQHFLIVFRYSGV